MSSCKKIICNQFSLGNYSQKENSFFFISSLPIPHSLLSISYRVSDRKLITFSSCKEKILYINGKLFFIIFSFSRKKGTFGSAASAKKCIHELTQVETDCVLFRSTKIKNLQGFVRMFSSKRIN